MTEFEGSKMNIVIHTLAFTSRTMDRWMEEGSPKKLPDGGKVVEFLIRCFSLYDKLPGLSLSVVVGL